VDRMVAERTAQDGFRRYQRSSDDRRGVVEEVALQQCTGGGLPVHIDSGLA
jgi:hypothetical protein